MGLVEICTESYENLVRDENEWPSVQDLQIKYISAVLAAAKQLGIEPISKISLPQLDGFDNDKYKEFRLQVDFYLMQLALQSADRNHRLSINLVGTTKQRLQTLAAALREHVQKLDIPTGRIDRLLDRITHFEKDLEGPRLTFGNVAAMTLFVAGAIADLGAAGDQIYAVIKKVEVTIGQAKEEQDKDAANHIPYIELKKLAPPGPQQTWAEYEDPFEVPNNQPTKAPFDLDDEIPF